MFTLIASLIWFLVFCYSLALIFRKNKTFKYRLKMAAIAFIGVPVLATISMIFIPTLDGVSVRTKSQALSEINENSSDVEIIALLNGFDPDNEIIPILSAAMLREVKKIPGAQIEENLELYNKLAQILPEDESINERVQFYTAKKAEQQEIERINRAEAEEVARLAREEQQAAEQVARVQQDEADRIANAQKAEAERLAREAAIARRNAWRNQDSTNEMTNEKSSYASSVRVSPSRQMEFPYGDVAAWVGVGCNGDDEWAYIGFSDAPNLAKGDTEDGYDVIRTRIRWGEDIFIEEFTQEWGASFIQFRNDANVISNIVNSDSMLLELQWYSEQPVFFDFPLNAASEALSEIRSRCANY